MTRRQPPISPRYVGLLFGSLQCILFGFAYTPLSNVPVELPLGVHVVSAIVPLWVFGAAWFLAGVAGVVTIVRRRRGVLVFAVQSALLAIWTLGYVFAFALGDPRAWVTAGWLAVGTGMVMALTRVDPPLWVIRLRGPWTR